MKKISGVKLQRISLHLLTQVLSLLFAVSVTKANVFLSQKPDEPSIIGRWDITINKSGKDVPSWLEVTASGFHTLVGRFVGEWGSARPISRINFLDGKLSFSIPPQWEPGNNDISVEGVLQGDSLSGTLANSDGKNY